MRRPLRHLLLLALAAAAAACEGTSDAEEWVPTGPEQPLLFPGGVSVNVLQRTDALDAPITKTATIGASGGVIAIPELGFSIDFPRNALTAPTSISVTALAGTDVAYEFAPHGLAFAKPPRIVQELTGTPAYRNRDLAEQLEGAYAPDLSAAVETRAASAAVAPRQGNSQRTVRVTEVRPGGVDSNHKRMRFEIDHFSGYLAAHGRSSAAN